MDTLNKRFINILLLDKRKPVKWVTEQFKRTEIVEAMIKLIPLKKLLLEKSASKQALLALGSGSKKNRQRSVIVPLDKHGINRKKQR
jgi:hypothetical protein